MDCFMIIDSEIGWDQIGEDIIQIFSFSNSDHPFGNNHAVEQLLRRLDTA